MYGTKRCKAYRQSDQMVCPQCGYAWDINDPDRPKCLSKQDKSLLQIQNLRVRLFKPK